MTTTLTRTVRPATMGDPPGVARVLGRAFREDPLFRWMFPDDMRRIARTTRASALMAGFSYVPLGYSAVVEAHEDAARGPVIRGVALWSAPDGSAEGTKDALRALPHWLGLLGPRRFARTMHYFSALKAHVPHEPHWYLSMLGADPAVPGSGAGTLLLRAGLERAGTGRVPVFLETMNPADLGYYARFGFEVTATVAEPDTPVTHLLVRPPAPA
ncbi:GNAT family N-acetyltransferase [Nocardiopsis sp. N85]|uniref:GNAT family N-acetyltransferase n=1 Tax=Nocardiopsis sp. N85 TaxID=3029400 RepID=UPI00237FA0D3|nr:GNAT family N-acetyltransferase [Nocardiopsis sp. N85]MDE3721185.1 GNAT family N-acetyltransferase [Nocardiopsis sp. N85]